MPFNNLGFGGGYSRSNNNPFAVGSGTGIDPRQQQQLIQQQLAQRLEQQQAVQQAQQQAQREAQQAQQAQQEPQRSNPLTDSYMRKTYELPVSSQNPRDLTKFGQNIKLPQAPENPADKPMDFGAEYEKIRGNTPRRLAYQELIEQGAPRIERSKWARLAAALGAGAIATSPEAGSAQMGYNMGRTALEAPQVKATAEYERRKKGYSDLADFEERDKANELKALEVRYNDQYKQSAEKRAISQEQREQTESADRLETSRDARSRANFISYEDKDDGNTYLVKRDGSGEKIKIGKTGQTTEERVAEAKLEEQAKEDIRWTNRKKELDIQGDTQRAVARIGADSRENVAETNKAAKIAAAQERNQSVLKALPPGQQITQVWADVTNMLASDPALKDIALDDYVETVDIGGGNKMIKVKPPRSGIMGYGGGDSPADAGIKQRINQYITQSMTRSQTPGANTNAAGRSAPPPASAAGAGSTSTGRRYQITPVTEPKGGG